MKVILLEDVKNHGVKGDVVDVSPGYARNYLFPRNLAVEANKKNMAQLKERKKVEAKRMEQELKEAKELAKKLEGIKVALKAKSGEKGKLFGSITSKEIAEALEKQHGIKLDRRKIVLDEPIKTLGEIELDVKVYPEVTAKLKVSVEAE
ncbi:MAG TPA: 50S ribosomal protein L9 [Clostridiales bacterium]|nr:50S ribosomal protein L9 [Clostridiales bacterium]